jgi:hypothetical protein
VAEIWPMRISGLTSRDSQAWNLAEFFLRVGRRQSHHSACFVLPGSNERHGPHHSGDITARTAPSRHQFRSILQESQRPPAIFRQLAAGPDAAAGSLHELFRNQLAAFVVSAIREPAAQLIEHCVHIGLGVFIKLAHNQLASKSKDGIRNG